MSKTHPDDVKGGVVDLNRMNLREELRSPENVKNLRNQVSRFTEIINRILKPTNIYVDDKRFQARSDKEIVRIPVYNLFLQKILEKKDPVLFYESTGESLKLIFNTWLECRDNKFFKPAINIEKDPKSGKTKDIQYTALLLSIINYLQTGNETYPLIILTSNKEGENQLISELELTTALFSHLTFNKTPESRWAITEQSFTPHLDSFFQELKRQQFFARRVVNRFDASLKIVAQTIEQGYHRIILVDEADHGAGPGQLLASRLKEYGIINHVFDLPSKQQVSLLNFSAYLGLAEGCEERVVTIKLPEGKGYVKISDVPKFSTEEFSDIIKVNLEKLTNTAASKNHPYKDDESGFSAYVKMWHGKEVSKLDPFTKKEMMDRHKWYRNKYVPETIVHVFKASCSNAHKFIGNGNPYNLMTLRYVCDNRLIVDLTKKIRNILPQSEGLVIPFCGVKDEFCGKKINWKDHKDLPNAIKTAYEIAGIKQQESPILVLVSAGLRRTEIVPSHHIMIDLTGCFTTISTNIQTNGRAAGYNKESIIVITKENLLKTKEIENGTPTLPASLHSYRLEPSKKTTNIQIKRGMYPKGDYVFEQIDEHIFNAPYMIKTLNNGKRLQGGKTAFSAALKNDGIVIKSIFEIVNNDFMDSLEQDSDELFKEYIKGSIKLLRPEDKTEDGYFYHTEKGFGYAGFRNCEKRLSGTINDDKTFNTFNRGKIEPQIFFSFSNGRMRSESLSLRLIKEIQSICGINIPKKNGYFGYMLSDAENSNYKKA